jgi:excisionase family DNA binding protein
MSFRRPPGGWRHWYLGWESDARRADIEASLDKDWYTVEEAAKVLGEHPKTVRKRVREGEIKASRPSPRKTKIHKRDLADYLMQT